MREPKMLWVDDSKPVPDGCSVARTYDDAQRMLSRYEWDVLYLDFDLGDEHNRNGLHLLRWADEHGRVPPVIECISWNPDGRKRIEALAADIASRRIAGGPRG